MNVEPWPELEESASAIFPPAPVSVPDCPEPAHEQQPVVEEEYSFNHSPPPTILGCNHWPGTYEANHLSTTPTLHDFMPWIRPYLTVQEKTTCRVLNRVFTLSHLCSNLPFTRPWQPHRRRKWGFGSINKNQSCTSDIVTGQLIMHHVWRFLTPQSRARVMMTSSTMNEYAKLRGEASTMSVAYLRHIRPAPTKLQSLDPVRARAYGAALLRFDFIYGDFVRWLSGEYTNRHRDWQAIFSKILKRTPRKASPDLPKPDLSRVFRVFTVGAPLVGNFTSPFKKVVDRDKYDNHPAINKNMPNVEAKFATEEAKTFHVHVPRFLIYFIPGLFLAPRPMGRA